MSTRRWFAPEDEPPQQCFECGDELSDTEYIYCGPCYRMLEWLDLQPPMDTYMTTDEEEKC